MCPAEQAIAHVERLLSEHHRRVAERASRLSSLTFSPATATAAPPLPCGVDHRLDRAVAGDPIYPTEN